MKTEHLWRLCRGYPGFFQLWEEGRGPGQNLKTPRIDCAHRGDLLRLEPCASCGGAVLLKVFSCEQHGACTLSRQLPGVATCQLCDDYVAAEAARGEKSGEP